MGKENKLLSFLNCTKFILRTTAKLYQVRKKSNNTQRVALDGGTMIFFSVLCRNTGLLALRKKKTAPTVTVKNVWKDPIFSDIRNMSVFIAPNNVRCAVIPWLLLFLRSVWSPSKVTFTAITLLIQAFFKSYGQFSLVCYRDNNIKPCFPYMRMIKINSKPFVISDKKWPTPFNMSSAPLSLLPVFREHLHSYVPLLNHPQSKWILIKN